MLGFVSIVVTSSKMASAYWAFLAQMHSSKIRSNVQGGVERVAGLKLALRPLLPDRWAPRVTEVKLATPVAGTRVCLTAAAMTPSGRCV